MENSTLKIRILCLKDSTKTPLNDILYYIKKLTQVPSEQNHGIILEPNDMTTAIVISNDETFDWNVNEGNFCQVIFLSSKTQPKARGDVILHFHYLSDLLNDKKSSKKNQSELVCSMNLDGGDILELSIHRFEGSLLALSNGKLKKHRYDKISSRQSIRGHLMKIKQFNHPVHCALCHNFIWGLHLQGFECVQCSLVTHKKCYQQIPFWCQKASHPDPLSTNESARLKFHIVHSFKQYEVPFVRAIVGRNHGHCYHCGAQIFRNALKCTQCDFLIHEHCQENIPPMCTIPYNSMGSTIIGTDIFRIASRPHPPKVPIDEEDRDSKSSSYDLSWLGPLPPLDERDMDLFPLPTFEDFQYIGRLGDGAFAQVYCVEHIESKKFLAIKVADGTNEQARQQLEVERQILFRYSQGNPYMIKAYCTFHQGNRLFLLMELVEGGSLYHKIQTTRMTEDEIKFYLAELISVLQYLHSRNIVYRDLKLEHAVVSSAGHIRLIDFGLGRILKTPDEPCHTFCGTYSYMAPEVRKLEHEKSEKGYSYPVDFWALGIVLLQLLIGERIDFPGEFYSYNPASPTQLKSPLEQIELPSHRSIEARSCVMGLLEIDPDKRLGSPNSPHGFIRDHPFFKVGRQIDWQEIDEELFKSFLKNPKAERVLSDASIHQPLSTLMLDRGSHGKSDWIAAGQSTCTKTEEETFQSFDYMNQSSWIELIQSNVY